MFNHSSAGRLLQLVGLTNMIYDWNIWQEWTAQQRQKKMERARTIESMIRDVIELDEGVDLNGIISNSIDQSAMRQRHQKLMHRCIEFKLRPVLLIMDPSELFLDPNPITIPPDDLALMLECLNFNHLIMKHNKWNLRFTKPSERTEIDGEHQLIAYRPKLISFLFWLESLSKLHDVAFEIVLYSNGMDTFSMMFHLNLIQIYYNMVVRKRYPRNDWFRSNLDEWFMFNGGIASNQKRDKTLKEIERIYPLKDYEFTLIAGAYCHEWESLKWKSQNTIGVLLPLFRHHLSNVTVREVLNAMIYSPEFGKDDHLMILHEAIKKLVSDNQTLSIFKKLNTKQWMDGGKLAECFN